MFHYLHPLQLVDQSMYLTTLDKIIQLVVDYFSYLGSMAQLVVHLSLRQ